MFGQAHYPEEIAPNVLDQYLEDGWFRMGQTIFTTSFLNFNNQFYRAIWLRVVMDEFVNSSTIQKLLKSNSCFDVKVRPATITQEKEDLFTRYKEGVPFEASESLEQLLYGGAKANLYNTFEVCLYDDDKLIGTGYFDLGKDSAAGISSFYDPAYKKYSLGKYMIYQKMLYCKNLGLQYFYLGYFAPGYPAFDYKLTLSKTALEYYDLSSQNWLPMSLYKEESGSINQIWNKLKELQDLMDDENIECRLLTYKYFDANLMINLHGLDLFDYPMFVYCFPFFPEAINPIIVYDIRDERYHLLKCISFGVSEEPNDHTSVYTAQLLKTDQIIYSSPNAEDLVAKLIHAIQAMNSAINTIIN